MTNIAKEWVDNAHYQFKEEEAWCIVAVQTLFVAEKRIKDLDIKLTKVDR